MIKNFEEELNKGICNFVFLGEAGCGKTEACVNLALLLSKRNDKEVHFFDLDMTKPLFRSRELSELFEKNNIELHFEEQFMDAPTTVGGPSVSLRNKNAYTILDVGGDYMGAFAIGQYFEILKREDTKVYYLINPFRPWSRTIEKIDLVLSEILGSCKLSVDKLSFIGNPNLGKNTTKENVLFGIEELEKTVSSYIDIEFYLVKEAFVDLVAKETNKQLMPINIFIEYPWNDI